MLHGFGYVSIMQVCRNVVSLRRTKPLLYRLYSTSNVHIPILTDLTSDEVAPLPPIAPRPDQIDQISNFISSRKKLIVITGAGCSTESGVPDYRSPNGSYSKGHKPTTFQDFVNKPQTRKRYWARSMFGYLFFNKREPNPTHQTLAALEKEGYVHHLITQNVDRLHHKAGHKHVIELHGNNETIMSSFQTILQTANPDWMTAFQPPITSTRPDGDADLGIVDYSTFVVPDCTKCGGMLKPEVVFFGENVPVDIVQKAMDLVNESDGMLAIGSSLQVFSVFRFVKAAHQKSIPIVILNIGPTRADDLESLAFKVEGRSGEVLPLVYETMHTTGAHDSRGSVF